MTDLRDVAERALIWAAARRLMRSAPTWIAVAILAAALLLGHGGHR